MDITAPRLRRAYFECRHGQLHVHNAIPVGGGFDELTTLICIHGSGGSGRQFLELSKRLGASRSIYSPDLPGSGESDGPAVPLSAATYADAIADFLDSLRFRQVDLLGAGTGAAIVAELAITRPKIVRKVCALAGEWQADRRASIKQPVLSLDQETDLQADADAIARRLTDFFAAS
jgi:pimeloyl-ACP methyl ester carboxylesterase